MAYTSILEGHLQIFEKTEEGLALRESDGPVEGVAGTSSSFAKALTLCLVCALPFPSVSFPGLSWALFPASQQQVHWVLCKIKWFIPLLFCLPCTGSRSYLIYFTPPLTSLNDLFSFSRHSGRSWKVTFGPHQSDGLTYVMEGIS